VWDDFLIFIGGNWLNFVHQTVTWAVVKINQNVSSEVIQFIGDKWGIIKSPFMVIKAWQAFVIY
jgi:hypothetical protein